jgi:hypothetical protein
MIINENFSNSNEKDYLSLINNKLVLDKFEKEYLPNLEKTQDALYIITNKYIYSTTGAIHQKYLHFNKDGKLLTDPKYNYTEIDTTGYMMKVILRYPITGDYIIDYFIKLDELRYSKNNSIFNNVLKQTYVFETVDYRNIVEDHIKKSLVTSNDFFTNYLNFDLK